MQKFSWVVFLFLLTVGVAIAADPISIQQLFQNAPKETAPQGATRVVTVRGGVIRQMSYSSVRGAGSPATNIIRSVNSKTGDVVLTHTDVGAISPTEAAGKFAASYTHNGSAYTSTGIPVYYGTVDPAVPEPYIWLDSSGGGGGEGEVTTVGYFYDGEKYVPTVIPIYYGSVEPSLAEPYLWYDTTADDPSAYGGYVATPVANNSTCTVGQWSVDSTYFYVCKGVNTWSRISLSTW